MTSKLILTLFSILVFGFIASKTYIKSGSLPIRIEEPIKALNLDNSDGAQSVNEQINDCPYIFYQQDKIVVKWIEAGELIEKIYNNTDFKKLKIKSCEEFKAKYLRINPSTAIDNKQKFDGVSKMAILSDIHGQHDLFIELLKAHKIIDKKGDWNFGDGHFVIVGDVFDRGDKVTETLWFLYKLEQQAIKSGGKVHLLLGNHEMMVLMGDLRYINDKYVLTSEKLGMTYNRLYDANTLIGQWIRTKPVAVSINDIAFTHAGFSPQIIDEELDIARINQLFHEEIIDNSKDSIMGDALLKFMIKSNGPIWYRGYFKDTTFTTEKARQIVDAMGVKAIVVGHTSMAEIKSHYDGLIYSVDSSIKKGKYGEILFYEGGKFSKGTPSGEVIVMN